MIIFVSIAVLMVFIAVAVIVVPLIRSGGQNLAEGKPFPWVIVTLVALLIPINGLTLYALNTSWSWQLQPQAHQGAQAIANQRAASLADLLPKMERRLREQGGTVNDWTMMGRAFEELGEVDKAVWAYGKAYALDGGSDPVVIAGYGQALVFADQANLTGPALVLFEKALEKAPRLTKALWWSGLAAEQMQDYELARQRWSLILENNPPEQVVRMVRERLAQVGGPVAVEAPAVAATATKSGSPAGAIQLNVNISPELKQRLTNARPLFVFARNAQGGGPPLAVVQRSSSELPVTVSLSDENAMMPGTKLANFDKLRLVARVSFGGTPTAQPGDFFGQVDYSMSEEGPVNLVIDQVVP